ncbi:hypothetical protein H9Q08_08750 [Chryseobacterium sp. PS-8]|uniref:Uncharacterized protein n=1 Tax=Chryseobacterium indicum TaxID=2766954 RepID=A0ABS9C492_9FLAO|nr:hypothetical protein [Chryseobacterium sp. PS-8]MCF2219392.1 hypothetical protein [Chryseobacterium sp. PS-8]
MSEKKLKITTTENGEIRVSDEETFIVDFTTLSTYNYCSLKDLPRIQGESNEDYNFRQILKARNDYKIAAEFLIKNHPDFKKL